MKSTRLKGSHNLTPNRNKDMKTAMKDSKAMGKMPAKQAKSSKPSVATKGKSWGERHRAGIKK
jgi:hypothetical protein